MVKLGESVPRRSNVDTCCICIVFEIEQFGPKLEFDAV